MTRRLIAPTPLLATRRRFVRGSIAIAATAAAAPRFALGQEQEVNVYNWDTYIAEDTVETFTEATGIAVRYDLYASNDELFAKLREGNPGYDVIYPTNDYVERMIAADMVLPLDHDRIPNRTNIDPAFADPGFDPALAHSMPYFWGTVGIGYRADKASPTGWADLFEREEHAGRISLLATLDTIQCALRYLGHSVNTRDPAHLDEVAAYLIEVKPRVRAFAPDTGQDLLISGEVDLAMEYNGDILQVMAEDDGLAFVVPKEGTVLWSDNMCIPRGAPHPEAAHAWIDYILDAEVHGAIASYVQYACPNAAAIDFIPEADRNNPALYPPREVLERCEVSVYKGESVESLYQRALTRVLAA